MKRQRHREIGLDGTILLGAELHGFASMVRLIKACMSRIDPSSPIHLIESGLSAQEISNSDATADAGSVEGTFLTGCRKGLTIVARSPRIVVYLFLDFR